MADATAEIICQQFNGLWNFPLADRMAVCYQFGVSHDEGRCRSVGNTLSLIGREYSRTARRIARSGELLMLSPISCGSF
jgi:hypothetical protein